MRELTAVVWTINFTYICYTDVVTGSRNRDFPLETREGLHSGGAPLFAHDRVQEGNANTLGSAGRVSSRIPSYRHHGLNVPRILSMRPRVGTNEFGHTSLTWSDASEDEESNSAGSGTQVATHTDTSSSANGSGPGARERSPSQTGSLSEAAASATSSGPAASSSTSVLVSPGGHSEPSTDERHLQEALEFTVRKATRGVKAGLSGGKEASNYMYADSEECKIAFLFGEMKAARLIGAVVDVRGVTVDHVSGEVRVDFHEKASVHVGSAWKKQRNWMKKAVGVVREKMRTTNVALPSGCWADPFSRYYVMYNDAIQQKSKGPRVQAVVIQLSFRNLPFRVPRTFNPKPLPPTLLPPPNEWIRKKCSWILAFSRYVRQSPVLRIDRMTGVAAFDNAELKDLFVSLSENNDSDDLTACDWSTPILSSMYVSTNLQMDPPEWKVQLDLAPSDGPLPFIYHVKLGNGNEVGLPSTLKGRGRKGSSKRGSWQTPVQ